MKEKWKKIHESDNVAVALEDLSAGTTVTENLILTEDIPAGHKFSLRQIQKDESIIKYGSPIGHATEVIEPGRWVHTHNLKTDLCEVLDYQYAPVEETLASTAPQTFEGFKRENGKAGIRNEIWILPTVGCVSSVAKRLEELSKDYVEGSIDGIHAFTHPYGCSQMGEDQDAFRQMIADLASHPNAGGVLLLGLGCENSGIDTILPRIENAIPGRIETLICQDSEDEIKEGLEKIKKLCEIAKDDQREPIPSSELIIGLKCGGSDGLSGITANPLVGKFSDKLVSQGGTTILTEVPEMFGAETLLMNRAKDDETFEKTVSMVNGFKQYFIDHNQTIYENPSPGNKKGGISTLEDKSLGCTQKSGSAQVNGVLQYAEPVREKGLNLLYGPGNDLVASTALAASGAQIVLFTTGRGTPFASPVPTIKISSNSSLANRKGSWIDFNAGELVEGENIDSLSDELFSKVLRVAEGERTRAEESGYHDMAIFKRGITL